MRYYVVLRYIGLVLLLNALFMAISGCVSLIYSDSAFLPLMYGAFVTALFGVFPIIFIPAFQDITNKEGVFIVVASWLLSCLVGTIPYLLWGGPFDITNAWFESVSGYTTTGSTILIDIEALPMGLLFWRAATHWIGGIGIIIFVLSVLPFLGAVESILYRTEVSSMVRENFHYRARKAIQIIAGVYLLLTFLETVALIIAGMNVFDAVTHSFATIATGGFSPKNASIAYYDNVAVEIIVMIFMVLSGIHFALLFNAFTGKFKYFWKSSVVRYYLAALVIGILISSINIYSRNATDYPTSLRSAAFNIISVGTSTGFANANTAIWPGLSQLLLLFFALQCACAGSTSGGIKVDRVVILWKTFLKYFKKMMHPNAVIAVRVDKDAISEDLVNRSVLYVAIYILFVFISTMLLCIFSVNLLEAFSGTVAAMGNVGPGLGEVGSVGNYANLPIIAKWILSLMMLLGRLEIFAFLIIFTRSQWSKQITY